MSIKKIIEFAEKNGYVDAVYLNEWRGYSCYEPILSDKGISHVGLPLIIMVQGEEIRMSTPEEAIKHLDETE